MIIDYTMNMGVSTMILTLSIEGKLEQDLLYAVMELDLLTCQEGQCLVEPAHWTAEDVVNSILYLYLKDLRNLTTIKPVPSKIWDIILPKTGRSEPPPSYISVVDQLAATKGGKAKKRKAI